MQSKEMNKPALKRSLTVSRRGFFKASGLAAGIAGLGALTKATPAIAGEKPDSALVNFAIKKVNKPSYLLYPYEGAEKLARFDEALTAFNNRDLQQGEFGGKRGAIAEEGAMKLMKEAVPGYTLLDQTLYDAGWTSARAAGKILYSWEPLGVAKLKRVEQLGKWEASPEDNNKYIKKAGYVYGAADIGIAPVNEQWFYSQDAKGKSYIFSDRHDKPEITEEAYYIPKSMNRVVVIIVPMDGTLLKYAPSALAEGTIGQGYSLMAETAGKLAEFIRGLGYNAIPMGNDTGLSVPMAIDAGLGELGRHGLLIHPEWGSLLRISKVLTDMPIAPDKPIKFGVAEFCRTCMKCAEKCPSESISFDKDPSYDVQCPSNNPGMKKWYVNTWTCLKFWTENAGGCPTCVGVCTYSKPKTWIHDVVKGISAKTTVFNSTFANLDDVFGYGSTLDENDPLKWWHTEGRPKKWD